MEKKHFLNLYQKKQQKQNAKIENPNSNLITKVT